MLTITKTELRDGKPRFTLDSGKTVSLSYLAKISCSGQKNIQRLYDAGGAEAIMGYCNNRGAQSVIDPTMVISARGIGRATLFLCDNGGEYTAYKLAKYTNTTNKTITSAFRRGGIDQVNSLFRPKEIGMEIITPVLCKEDQLAALELEFFNRRKVCIQNHIACDRYGECQDDRIEQGTDWVKPEGECYHATPEPIHYGCSALAHADRYMMQY